MEIFVLFIQRKEQYEGQHAPEAVMCIDEFSLEGGIEWWKGKAKKKVESFEGEISGHAVVRFEVNQEKVRELCISVPSLEAKMKKDN
jgi:hypothetical protein